MNGGNGTSNDVLEGGAGDDTLNGGEGDDLLEDVQGLNALNGGAGADTLIGGSGSVLTGGFGVDSFTVADSFGDPVAVITDLDPAAEPVTVELRVPQALLDLGQPTLSQVDTPDGLLAVMTFGDGSTEDLVLLQGITVADNASITAEFLPELATAP